MDSNMTVCTMCRRKGTYCPGLSLLQRLSAAINDAGACVDAGFAISGTVRLTECDSDCLMAWHATRKAVWLFGGVDPAQSIDDLIALGSQYRDLPPPTGEDLPAVVMAAEVLEMRLS